LSARSTSTGDPVTTDFAALTDSRLAAHCAENAQQAFFEYQSRFDAITRRARERFLARDWAGSFDDAAERLHFYNDVLDDLTNRIKNLMGARLEERSIWAATKAVYSSLIAKSSTWEIAETFFNSLTRRVFATDGRLSSSIPISMRRRRTRRPTWHERIAATVYRICCSSR
jgi:isocitrate dehydrogenase kinase/phosphatase